MTIDEDAIVSAMGNWSKVPVAFFVPDDNAELYGPMPDCLSQSLLIASCKDGEEGTSFEDINNIISYFHGLFVKLATLRGVLCGALRLSWDTKAKAVSCTLVTDLAEIHLHRRAIWAQAGVNLNDEPVTRSK